MLKLLVLIFISTLTAFFLLILTIYLRYMGKKNLVERQLEELNSLSLPEVSDFSIYNPYRGEGKYLKAQLHTHTRESDGKIDTVELVRKYKDAEYSFLAITDHDKITEYRDLDDDGFLTIIGEEMTQPDPFWPLGRHISRLFVKEHLKGKAVQSRLDLTLEEGGVVVINHPSTISGLGTQRWLPSDLKDLNGFYLMEIVNHFSQTEKNIRYWHGLLKEFGPDRPVWGIAADDTHRPEDIDRDWIMVRVNEINEDDLACSLERGSFYCSQGPLVEFGVSEGSIYARTGVEMNIVFIDADHNICLQEKTMRAEFRPDGHEGFIRVEVEDPDSGKKAWSQPFWLIDKAEASCG